MEQTDGRFTSWEHGGTEGVGRVWVMEVMQGVFRIYYNIITAVLLSYLPPPHCSPFYISVKRKDPLWDFM